MKKLRRFDPEQEGMRVGLTFGVPRPSPWSKATLSRPYS
jgi:hypothetical protein